MKIELYTITSTKLSFIVIMNITLIQSKRVDILQLCPHHPQHDYDSSQQSVEAAWQLGPA